MLIVMIVLALIALAAAVRVRSTYLGARRFDRSAVIRSQLAQLRKKREEDGGSNE
ncbi:hypothetical protein [Paenibacillus xerothermodurans]|uniref:hypothetical protein n=1 Tax=Paenibacillus xerothermodurans TaxID=1977292 RepID=UPI001402D87F|nr:hypothetical protein [Paenibacillus xerothermodurans]